MPPGHVQLDGLCKRFAEIVAVDNLSLEIRAGEFFSLLGPSGCGKTTTLRLVAGFEEPTSGRIMLDGSTSRGFRLNKRNVNTVFQSYALFPFLDVAGNVAFGLRYQSLDRSEIQKARRRDARARTASRLRETPGEPTVRRSATTCCPRTCARPAASGPAFGRAARGARRKAPPDLQVELKAIQERVASPSSM